MVFETIALFVALCFGFGFTASSFLPNSENFLERTLMRLGFGLATIPLVGVAISLVGIPLDWRILAVLALVYPCYYLGRNYKTFNFKIVLSKSNISIGIMLLIFAASFYVYASGAFSYPYLENDDSWGHAEGVKYVATEKSVFLEPGEQVRYMHPYPPAYDLIFGVLHQVNGSVYWTLKFFNALIISLSIIFFYFFAKELTDNRNKALFATFVLASIPAFLSHFIWALALTIPLFFVSFYAVERIKHDRKWWIVAGLVMFSALTSSPTHSIYFGLFFTIYLFTKMIVERKILLWHAAAGLFGLGLSFLLWWLPMIVKFGVKKTIEGTGFSFSYGLESLEGTADRIYTIGDFFIAQHQNMINNPVGIGFFVCVLVLIGLGLILFNWKRMLEEQNRYIMIVFAWFIFALYAVNASPFAIKLSPFRAWVVFAIPVAILAAEGAFFIMNSARNIAGNNAFWVVVAVLIVGIYATSAAQKISVNTAQWPPGGFWTSGEELAAYLWMKDGLPDDAKVFTVTAYGPIVGFDKYVCSWCADMRQIKARAGNMTTAELLGEAKSRGYEYIIVDGIYASKFGPEAANLRAKEIGEQAQVAFQNQGAIIFKI